MHRKDPFLSQAWPQLSVVSVIQTQIPACGLFQQLGQANRRFSPSLLLSQECTLQQEREPLAKAETSKSGQLMPGYCASPWIVLKFHVLVTRWA